MSHSVPGNLMAMEPRALGELAYRLELGARCGGVPAGSVPRIMAGCEVGGVYRPFTLEGGLAVVHIDGPVYFGAGILDQIFGGVIPTACVIDALRAAAGEPSAAAIVIDAHCPGGSVAGMSDLIGALEDARAVKPVYCIAHDQATSLMHWLGSLCDEFVATPMAVLGSIGVRFPSLYDSSAMLEKEGVKLKQFVSAPAKGLGEFGAPVNDQDAAFIQRMTDRTMEDFAQGVARGRGLTVAAVKALKAELFVARDAKAHGLIDDVIPYAEYIARKVKEHSAEPFTPSAPRARRGTHQPIETAPDHPEAQETVMSEKTPVAPKTPAVAEPKAPEVKAPEAEAKAPVVEAVKPPAATFPELKAAFGGKSGGAEHIVAALEAGHTMLQAASAWNDKLEARLAAVEESKGKLPPVGVQPIQPVATFTPSAGDKGTAASGEPADFAAAVKVVMGDEDLKAKPPKDREPIATARAAKRYPALHAAWREGGFVALKLVG